MIKEYVSKLAVLMDMKPSNLSLQQDIALNVVMHMF